MPRSPFRFSVLLIGLMTAQAIASIQVYLSNRAMYERLDALVHSGYRHLPGSQIAGTLLSWRPAFGGGLFFTLSIGAGVTMATLAIFWAWDRLGSRSRPLLYLILLCWMVVLVAVNLKGFTPLASAYFVLIPAAVVPAVYRRQSSQAEAGGRLSMVFHWGSIALLALLWSTQAQSGMFIAIRDNLLLANPVGVKINDYYYAYTHYSAEAISANQQKMFNTYSLSGETDPAVGHRLESVLAAHGYLLTGSYGGEDVRIRIADDRLVFRDHSDRVVHQLPVHDFFKKPAAPLKTLSQKTDRHRFFRRTIFVSLLIAFPLTLYWMLHTVFRACLSMVLPPSKSGLLSTALCFLVGAALILPVHQGRERSTDSSQLSVVLKGGDWRDQVTALKTVTHQNLEISGTAYRHLMESPHIAVQYWLARALGQSRRPETYSDLLRLLNAPYPNVVCQALYSLGRRGQSAAVKQILDIVDSSTHWYVQRYALQALRNLGWKHRRSI